MSDDPQSCERFQSELANRLGTDEVYNHPHLKHCELCCGLLIELDKIAEDSRNLKRHGTP